MKEMREAVTPIDLLIFLFLGYMIYGMDFGNMSIVDVAYLSAGILWFAMLGIRLAVVYCRAHRK